MTKIKNTKKGMAKKTLSMSLVVAMLATSNVPVWAAEFSDGSDATTFTSEAEAPAVSDDTSETVAAQAVAPQDVTVSTDANVMSLSAVENDGITITTTYRDDSSHNDTGCVAFIALNDNESITMGMTNSVANTKGTQLGWRLVSDQDGSKDVSKIEDGSYQLTSSDWNQYVGKKIACVVYQDITSPTYSGKDNGKVVAVTDVKIVPNTAQDYCTTEKVNAEWGNTLPTVNANMNYGAKFNDGAWYKDEQEVDADYKTTLADVGSVFKYKGTLSNTGDPDFDDETVVAQELTITGKSTSAVKRVSWSGFSTEIENGGDLTCDYDGNAHQLEIVNFTTKDGEKVSGEKFRYTYKRNGSLTSDFTSAGIITVTAIVEEAGVLAKGTKITANLKIKGIDISKDTAATLTANPLVYNKDGKYLRFNGKTGDDLADAVKKAGLVVEKNGKVLTYDKDYTVSSRVVKNEVGNDKVEVTITGTGNYTGTVLKKLAITAADISTATVSDIADQPYTGNQIKPVGGINNSADFIVKVNGETLVYNATDSSKSDYTLEYSNNVNVGKDATVTITGRGNYTGTITKKFTITAISLTNLKTAITTDADWKSTYDYTGKEINPIKDSYGWNSANAVWMKGRDFSVTYVPQNTNAGDVKAVITGINNYAGQTEEITFKINPVDISKVKANLSNVTYSPDLKNKKDEIKAGLKVTYKDMQLTENQDFTIVSVDITNRKVKLELKGIKNFEGTATVYADVTAKDINTVTLPKIDAQKYPGAEIKVDIESTGLKLKYYDSAKSKYITLVDKLALKDGDTVLTSADYYIINVENNTKVGTATINLGGKGNYTGKVSLSFPIVDQELNGTIVDSSTSSTVLKDVKYSYANASKIKGITYPNLMVMDEKGNDITDKCDITYSDNKAVGTATITATGKAGYKFSAVNTFRITPAEIDATALGNSLSLMKTTFDYTGEEIKPEYKFTAKDGDYTLVEGTDYKVEYVNNVDVYTGSDDTKKPTVKVTGLGNYAGKTADGKEITIPAYFTISKVTLASTDIVANDVAYASGVAVKPNVVITNSKSGKALVEGTDYKVTITEGGSKVGPAEAEIELTDTAAKNYNLISKNETKYTVKFNVTALDLSKATISPIADQAVTGEQIKPAVTVMNGSVKLTEGKDYEVVYGDNKEVGEGTVTIKALSSNKNYTGSQTVKFNIVKETPAVGQAMISEVRVSGNTVTPVLSGDVDGAVGYDYVIATEEDTQNGRVDISKNVLKTNTNFYYVQEGTYYAYCHAWTRDENGKKVFGEWSNIKKFTVDATTPSKPSIKSVKVKGHTVTVTFTASEDAKGYDVVLGEAVKKVNGENRPVEYGKLVVKNIEDGVYTATFYNVPDGKYYAGVHSYNKSSNDGKKVFSKWGYRKTAISVGKAN